VPAPETVESGNDPSGVRRSRLQASFLGRAWTRIRVLVFPEPACPAVFSHDVEALRTRLFTGDPELAAFVLARAEGFTEDLRDRIRSAEERAAGLQAAAAMAAAFSVAAAALLADPSTIHGPGWQLGFAAGVLLVVFGLVASA
jgi:hypothetical protein